MLLKPPGESGSLADESPSLGGAPQSQREAKAANKELVRTWLESEPNLTDADLVRKFKIAGIAVHKSTVGRYRKELGL